MALSADVLRLREEAPEYAQAMAKHQRRNFVLLMLDGATFAFAISLLSETTIIPAFVAALSESTLLIGLVAAVYALGHYLPQLAGSYLVTGRARRKPYVLAIVVGERVGILAIALTAQLIGVIPSGAVLVLFFIAFCGYAVTTGLIGPVYGDLIAKALTTGRGWYFGAVQLLGGLLGFSAALLGEAILRQNAFPGGIQLCFWICFSLSFISIFLVAGIKEIPYPHTFERPPLRAMLAEIPDILRGNRPYARYLITRSLLALATLGVGFVVVDGLSDTLRPSDAALLAAVFILSQAALGFGLGLVGNYFGWKVVVITGGVLLAAGMAGALLASSLPGYLAVFVALGGANAVTIIADPNMSIELAPADKTSLYLGTTSTLLAPFFIIGPLLAGAFASQFGYLPVFGTALLLAIVGTTLAFTVTEPRRITSSTAVGQPGAMP